MNNILLNTKIEGINVLKKYFSKFNSHELKYYLKKSPNISMNEFMDINVFDTGEIELSNFFLSHMSIVMKKIFITTSELNIIQEPIKISFISNSIYWNDLFVINNNIFVKYQYLIKIFECVEYNEYSSMNDIYIGENKIYDIGLLKGISYSIYSILQNLNPEAWAGHVLEKYGCTMVSSSDIKFSYGYKIIPEPNVNLSQGKITVYNLGEDNIYASFNSICSNDNTFSPYWDQKIIKLEYANGVYFETGLMDVEENKILSSHSSPSSHSSHSLPSLLIDKLIPTPFENISIQLTNGIIYN